MRDTCVHGDKFGKGGCILCSAEGRLLGPKQLRDAACSMCGDDEPWIFCDECGAPKARIDDDCSCPVNTCRHLQYPDFLDPNGMYSLEETMGTLVARNRYRNQCCEACNHLIYVPRQPS